MVKADFRKGDGAEMAIIEYVDRCVSSYAISVCVFVCLSLSGASVLTYLAWCRPGEIRKAKLPKGLSVVVNGEEKVAEVAETVSTA